MGAASALETAVIRVLRAWVFNLAAIAAFASYVVPASAATHVMVISGLGGEPQFDERFAQWSEKVALASVTATGDKERVYRLAGNAATADAITQRLRQLAAALQGGDQFVLVLLGHGSFDGKEYRFNIPGPDMTGTQLAELLNRLPDAVPQLVVNATSTSGALVDHWARPNRVVITATRNGGERNATRFGGHWANALSSDEADRDKDGALTAQEAYDFAVRKVEDAFKTDAAVATEHAKLVGAEPSRFVVARLGAAALFASDAQLLALRKEQGDIEGRLAQLRPLKAQLSQDAYFDRLEPVLVELARLGVRVDARLVVLGVKVEGVANAKP
jgi:hypothetical protein